MIQVYDVDFDDDGRVFNVFVTWGTPNYDIDPDMRPQVDDDEAQRRQRIRWENRPGTRPGPRDPGLSMSLIRVPCSTDSEIDVSTRNGNVRVFINKTLSTETVYQQDVINRFTETTETTYQHG